MDPKQLATLTRSPEKRHGGKETLWGRTGNEHAGENTPTTEAQIGRKRDKKRMGEICQTPRARKEEETPKAAKLCGRKKDSNKHEKWTQNTQHSKLESGLNEGGETKQEITNSQTRDNIHIAIIQEAHNNGSKLHGE